MSPGSQHRDGLVIKIGHEENYIHFKVTRTFSLLLSMGKYRKYSYPLAFE